jgi:hypothetical protein
MLWIKMNNGFKNWIDLSLYLGMHGTFIYPIGAAVWGGHNSWKMAAVTIEGGIRGSMWAHRLVLNNPFEHLSLSSFYVDLLENHYGKNVRRCILICWEKLLNLNGKIGESY